MTSELGQSWNGSAWVNSKQSTYTYDANNNRTSELYQIWNGGGWLNHSQYFYTYDANNNITNELDQSWNGSAWVNSYQYFYTYDANNNMTSELGQSWNGNAWVNSSQYTYTYDANNNITSLFGQSWNGSVWVNSYQYTSTYDSNNFAKSDSYKQWNSAGTEVTWGDSTYYYFHTVAGINDLMAQNVSITVFPNPASDNITIETLWKSVCQRQIEILNIHGQSIKSINAKENHITIDISDFSSGVYIIKAKTDEGIAIRKFVKE